MYKKVCAACMTVYDSDQNVCPCCGAAAPENKNPSGSLPMGMLLNDTYRVDAFLSLDSEGAIYDAVDITGRRAYLIKEYMPVTLCSGRAADLSLQVRVGSEVPYKNNAADFADLYAKLRHFNNDICLLSVCEVFYANNTVYAVTEKAEGLSLTKYLERCGGRIGWNEALDLLDPLWVSMEKLHRAGIIHRGICCDNITVTGPGVVRLGGYATQAMRSQGTELKAQLYAGYAAPEQYSSSDFDGAFTDIYALCAVLYRMVTGVAVPSARERLVEDTLEDPTVYTTAPLPDGSVQKLPVYLADAILHGLQLDCAERFADMTSFRMALTGQKKKAAAPAAVSGAARAPGGAVRTEPEKKNLWSRMNTDIKVALCTFAFLALIFAVVLGIWYGGREDEPDSDVSGSESVSVVDPSSTQSQPDSVPESQEDIITAPALVGKEFKTARLEFSDYRFSVTYEYSSAYAAGYITSQSPAAGEEVTDNTIVIVVSQGIEPIPLPDLEGNTRASAESLLNSLGIKYEIVTVINDGSWASDVVTETSPAADTPVQPGVDTVILRVASAKPEVSSADPSSGESGEESVPAESDSAPESDTTAESSSEGEPQ